MLRSLAIILVVSVAGPVLASPLPAAAPVHETAAQRKQAPLRYRMLEKMLRRFSREAGEPRARG